jgi:hypothetical protein
MEGAPVSLSGARHELVIGRAIHSGIIRSAVSAGRAHGNILNGLRVLVARGPKRAAQLWET